MITDNPDRLNRSAAINRELPGPVSPSGEYQGKGARD